MSLLLLFNPPSGGGSPTEEIFVTVMLSPGAATLPDGSASNLAPALQRVKSSATAPGIYALQLLFDDGTVGEEWVTWSFRIPNDYGTAPALKVQYKMTSATSGAVVWDARIGAVSPGDTTDVDAKGFGSANTVTSTVPGTAGYLAEASITLANTDSLAAGDFVVLRLARAATNGADTATGDAELVAVALTYTAV